MGRLRLCRRLRLGGQLGCDDSGGGGLAEGACHHTMGSYMRIEIRPRNR
jgi:hypothetical protein